MIAMLKGLVAGKSTTFAVIDVNGVGYEVSMAASALAKLPPAGEPVQVLTYLHLSENALALYGFLSAEEKLMFEKLIGVSGVGPKVALAALSTFSPQALADAIAAQDVALVQKIPGVGKKSASRIILELKGSLETERTLFGSSEEAPQQSGAEAGAMDALLSMGFTETEASLALKGAPADADEKTLIQYALKRLGMGSLS